MKDDTERRAAMLIEQDRYWAKQLIRRVEKRIWAREKLARAGTKEQERDFFAAIGKAMTAPPSPKKRDTAEIAAMLFLDDETA